MKKITLLMLATCSMYMFGQTNRTSDVDAPVSVKTPHAFTNPTKAFVTSGDYYNDFNTQNLGSPKLYGQKPNLTDNISSQQFETANTTFTARAADDFKVPLNKTWRITSVFAQGTTTGSAYPTSYNVTFYQNTAANLPGTEIRSENIILAAGSSSPTLLLATPLSLPQGTYWVTVQAVMDLSGGQWFWSTYNDTTTLNAPFAWTNPGNGFGTTCNLSWKTASVCLPSQLKDLQFSLDGTESSICKTITGRIATTDPTHSPRINRDAIPSVCGTTKVFPGNFGTGNFRYKSYTVQNTSATPDCVTLNIQNAEVTNQVHLMAYSGAFNPANLSQNYIGDIGSSTFNNSISSMGITIPANSTITLIVSEVVSNSTFISDYKIDVISSNCSAILKASETSQNNITIHPNPVKTILFVNGMKVKEASVYDLSGKIIPVKNTESEINVNNLTNGTYLLQLKDKDGKVYQEKFIKK